MKTPREIVSYTKAAKPMVHQSAARKQVNDIVQPREQFPRSDWPIDK